MTTSGKDRFGCDWSKASGSVFWRRPVIGRRMFETWHQMRTFLSTGLLDPTPVVTHRFPMEQINQALETIRSGAAGKVILEIGG